MNTELNPHEMALVQHLMIPMFNSFSAETKAVALVQLAKEGLCVCDFGNPLPENLIQSLKDIITRNEVLKDDDKLAEELFSPPKTELDV